MKALSLHPIYADAIAAGEKKEEYRTWQTPYRGDLLICASTYNDGPEFVRGHAICVAELYDIEAPKKGTRNFSWRLRKIRLIEPFPVKGKLHLFDVSDALVKPFPGNYKALVNHWLEIGLIKDD